MQTEYPKEFIQNKYLKWYDAIIQNARTEMRRRGCGVYYENHHILPKSMWPEFINDDQNKVLLTAKEHFICHHILTKCSAKIFNEKMTSAFMRMVNSEQHTQPIAAIVYENLKLNFSENARKRQTGKRATQATKEKMSKASLGKKKSAEHAANISKGRKGIKFSDEHLRKLSIVRTGKNASKEHYAFKGWYHTPIGKFPNPGSQHIVSTPTLDRWCKTPGMIIDAYSYAKSKYLKDNYKKDIIGKTFKDLGFWFELK